VAYLALFFDVGADDADRWSDALLDAGALSVDVTDPRAGTADEAPRYDEPGMASDAYWPLSRITAMFAAGSDAAAALAAAAGQVSEPLPAYQTYAVAEQDWVRATQQQFAPLRIADRMWIVPSWCPPPEPDAVNIQLDPGLAFGTGSHPTTRLCLQWLAQRMRRGARVLDYGCGSGILAIAARKLGAREAIGVDIDPQAITASRANAAANGVDATFAHVDAFAATTPVPFDVVVANILARPLVVLAPTLAAMTDDGGDIVLSGVLAEQADAVREAYAPWFRIAVCAADEGWVALAGARERRFADRSR
jgi:ribosomal protein L11 methyltransferase